MGRVFHSREGGREVGREGGREGGRDGGREGAREGAREGGREGGCEQGSLGYNLKFIKIVFPRIKSSTVYQSRFFDYSP